MVQRLEEFCSFRMRASMLLYDGARFTISDDCNGLWSLDQVTEEYPSSSTIPEVPRWTAPSPSSPFHISESS